MTNKAIRDIIEASNVTHNICNGGIKVFETLRKTDPGVTHSMTIHGRSLLLAFLNEKRKVEVSEEELKSILDAQSCRSIDFRDCLTAKSIEEIEKIVQKSGKGPICFVYQDVNVLAYVGQYTITGLLNKHEKYHALLMLDS